MKNKIYITTPLYYINASPHIGHSYTTIAADVLARYYKLKNKDVFLMTGTDEHGQKIEEAAITAKKNPKDFADEVVEKYKTLWAKLDINYDKFIRTTDDEHQKTVQKIIEIMFEKGDIYKGEYSGWYCTPCETYFLETELADKNQKICPDCSRELKLISEEAFFFKLSKYSDDLLKYFESNKDFLSPNFRAKEMLNFIKNGLKDLCITRAFLEWGIPFPLDKKYSVYVWFDALINYISGIGFLDFANGKNDNFKNIWPCDVHFVGKEIYKFHTVIWPAMLLSLGLELPKKVFGHGWWTFEGEKMSKSRGNVIDPNDVIAKFGKDALRFFVLREVPFGTDGDFCMSSFVEKYNNELANELGNLFSRTLKMLEKYTGGIVPEVKITQNILREKANETKIFYDENMQNIDFFKALAKIWELIRVANKYIEDEAPWKLAKNEADKPKLDEVLFNVLATMRLITLFLQPFMPESAKKMLQQLGIDETPETLKKNAMLNWEDLEQNARIGEITILFPRIDDSIMSDSVLGDVKNN